MNKKTLISSLNMILFLLCFQNSFSQKSKDEIIFKDHERVMGYRKLKRNNTAVFQGNRKRENYFEGWYFKMVSKDHSSIISIIPGISLSENGEQQHAFIQIINGKTANTEYYSYPIEQFSFSKNKFAVRIGQNYFSEDSIVINILNDTTSIMGTVQMSNQTKLIENNGDKNERKSKKAGIMGWYRHAPFMQCYHGVISLNHNLKGELTMNNKTFNFDNGLGYIEKDWGESMPSSWVWMQSNSFNSKKTSFMLSVANVPWMGNSFPGFLGFFLNDSIIQRFGTYSNAKLKMETPSSDSLAITIIDDNYKYLIQTKRDKSGILKAPLKGSMDRRIAESIDAELKLTVMDKEGKLIFQDSTSVAGLEIVGDVSKLRENISK